MLLRLRLGSRAGEAGSDCDVARSIELEEGADVDATESDLAVAARAARIAAKLFLDTGGALCESCIGAGDALDSCLIRTGGGCIAVSTEAMSGAEGTRFFEGRGAFLGKGMCALALAVGIGWSLVEVRRMGVAEGAAAEEVRGAVSFTLLFVRGRDEEGAVGLTDGVALWSAGFAGADLFFAGDFVVADDAVLAEAGAGFVEEPALYERLAEAAAADVLVNVRSDFFGLEAVDLRGSYSPSESSLWHTVTRFRFGGIGCS